MFEQLLFLTVVMLGVTLLRTARHTPPGRRGYVFFVAIIFGISLMAWTGGSRPLAFLAMAMTVLVVILPLGLERIARGAFTRGWLTLAARVARVRSWLMPGSGLSRDCVIFEGLALLEREGVDPAVAYFRDSTTATEDGEELAMLNEQILSVLFHGQRWDEGIAHYEARFHPRYAAYRPALALGLLRAYGESGQLGRAAGLLGALEDGPVGGDPRVRALVSQARLTFLAYAGAVRPVSAALTEEHQRLLGLSKASGALLRGIALARSGDETGAREQLRCVETLATRRERPLLDASERVLAGLDGTTAPAGVDAELGRFIAGVAERLSAFLRSDPGRRSSTASVATPVLIGAMLSGYAVQLVMGKGGYGVLVAGGVSPALWEMGQWERLLPSVFLHRDPLALLLGVYGLWLAVPLLERIYGGARVIAVGVVGAMLGQWASVLFSTHPNALFAGGPLVVAAVIAGALTSLFPFRLPSLSRRVRRLLAVPLVLLMVVLAAGVVPGAFGVDIEIVGLSVAIGTGVLGLGLVPPSAFRGRYLVPALAVALVIAMARLSARDGSKTLLDLPRRVVTLNGAALQVPGQFEPMQRHERIGFDIPIEEGWVDTWALQHGALVEVVATQIGDDDVALPMLEALDPALNRQLTLVPEERTPPSFDAAYRAAGGDISVLRSFRLRQNGTTVGICVERAFDSGLRVGLVASSWDVLGAASELYAQMLAGAVPSADAAPH